MSEYENWVRNLALGMCVFFANSCISQEMETWLRSLDNDSWVVRQDAEQNIRHALETPDSRAELLPLLHERLADSQLSFEARKVLSTLDSEWGKTAEVSSQVVSQSEVENALTEFLSETPAQRQAAAERLARWLELPQNTRLITRETRVWVLRETLSPDDLLRLELLERDARNAWLRADLQEIETVDKTRLEELIRTLAAAPLAEEEVGESRVEERTARTFVLFPGECPWGNDALRFLHPGIHSKEETRTLRCNWFALHELEDFMTVENFRPRVMEEIRNVLAEESEERTPAGEILLKRVVFLNEPCLAAEYWNAQSQVSYQFLKVGVPQVHEMEDFATGLTSNATQFDDLRENTVRCVRGKNLPPGVLPLNRVLAHPIQGSFFFLVPLDSPKKKLSYAEQTRDDGGKRFDYVSQSTVESLLAENRRLTREEIDLLEVILEPDVSSAFFGELLQRFEDGELAGKSSVAITNAPEFLTLTHHMILCKYLAKSGTAAAVPGLMAAIQKNTIRTQQSVDIASLAYNALFEIALRDPWHGMEEWLESLLDSEDYLICPDVPAPSPMVSSVDVTLDSDVTSVPCGDRLGIAEVAAGVLCQIRGISPEECGLEKISNKIFMLFGSANCCRFSTPESREIAKKKLCVKSL